jgi:dihydroorotase
MNTIFDTILTGGRLLDPAQGLDRKYTIAIQDGLIAAIFPESTAVQAARQFDVSGRLVIPGMIDTHAHVF